MVVGVYGLGALSDAIGRRRGFFASALLLGAAGLASAAAPNFPVLLLLRAVVGMGLGGERLVPACPCCCCCCER